MTGECWIYETSDEAGGEYVVFPIWLNPCRKPDSNEKHKHLHCGPETVQWYLLCNPGAFPDFFFLNLCCRLLELHLQYDRTQCPLKEWLCSGVIEVDVLVHQTRFLQNSSVRLCAGCDDELQPTPVSPSQLVSSSCWCRMSWHASLLSMATYGSMRIHRQTHPYMRTHMQLHPRRQMKAFNSLTFSFTST